MLDWCNLNGNKELNRMIRHKNIIDDDSLSDSDDPDVFHTLRYTKEDKINDISSINTSYYNKNE